MPGPLAPGRVMKTTYPKVTVIIVFLNQEKYLAEAVTSVSDQSRQDWELLLVDDGSTDRSTVMAREYEERFAGKIKYLEHPEHGIDVPDVANPRLGIDRALFTAVVTFRRG